MASAQIRIGCEARDQHQSAQAQPEEELGDHGKYWRTSARISGQLGVRLPPGPPPCHNGGVITIEVIASGLSKVAAKGMSWATRLRPMLVLISPPRAAAIEGTSVDDTCFAFCRMASRTCCCRFERPMSLCRSLWRDRTYCIAWIPSRCCGPASTATRWKS